MTIEALKKMPRSEKLRLLETLWEDLSRPESDYESPPWHAKELAETERRLAAGHEQVIEWETAKKKLRRQFE